jgi:hypothetical protein
MVGCEKQCVVSSTHTGNTLSLSSSPHLPCLRPSSPHPQDPSGCRLRLRLQPLLQDVAASLLQPDSAALFSLSSPLGLTGGVPLLPVSTAAFTSEGPCGFGGLGLGVELGSDVNQKSEVS